MARHSAPQVETALTLLEEVTVLDTAHGSDTAHRVPPAGSRPAPRRGASSAGRIGVHTAACWARSEPKPKMP